MPRRSASRPAWGRVCVILLDDAGMTEFNKDAMGRSGATDVIACAYDPHPGEAGLSDADIAVNLDRAASAAADVARAAASWTADDELALYLAHGCDHLHGGEDATQSGRRSMRARELRWLREARAAGLVRGLAAWR